MIPAGGQKGSGLPSPVGTANCIGKYTKTIGNTTIHCIATGQSTFRVGKKAHSTTVIRKPCKTIGETAFRVCGEQHAASLLPRHRGGKGVGKKAHSTTVIRKPCKTIGETTFWVCGEQHAASLPVP